MNKLKQIFTCMPAEIVDGNFVRKLMDAKQSVSSPSGPSGKIKREILRAKIIMASLMMKLLFLCLIVVASISLSLGAEAEQLTSEGRSKEKNIHSILHMPAEIVYYFLKILIILLLNI
uniref:Uncharacterized protein n=1 Tax=Manihot esculenta TaxID=3983 RepID=A0A2C9VHZ2_MANES